MNLFAELSGKGSGRYRTLFTVLKYAVVIACLGFVIHTMAGNYRQLQAFPFVFKPGWIVLSVLMYAGYTVYMSLVWHIVTCSNGIAVPVWKSVLWWHLPMLGKYTPGKVALAGGRLFLYAGAGVSKRRYLLSFFWENYLAIVAGILLLLVYNTFTHRFHIYSNALLLSVAAVAVAVMHPRLLAPLLRKAGMDDAAGGTSFTAVLLWLLLYAISWCWLGLATVVFMHAVYGGPEWLQVFHSLGAAVLGYVGGVLVFITPAGLGVREGLMTFGLRDIVPAQHAAMLAIAARLWGAGCELLIVAGVWLIAGRKKV